MRLNLPPGRAGLIVFAAAAAPLLLKSAKPLVRRMGRGLVKLGEQMSREAEAAPEVKPAEEPKPEPAKAKPRANRTAAKAPKAAAKAPTQRTAARSKAEKKV